MDLVTIIGNDNANCNIRILRTATKSVISRMLNPIKLIPNENGVPRDWHGLAELCNISGEIIRNISSELDPTSRVLEIWNGACKADATVKKLIQLLEELDRTDIVDDVLPLISEDLKLRNPDCNLSQITHDNDSDILTRDDVARVGKGLEPQHYDAFILFDDDDIDFATELIDIMEKTYELKFCVKERDLVGGNCEHDAIIRLITERCSKLIVIISPAFLQSNANRFFYNVAQTLAVEQRQRKIIPCIYKEVEKLPNDLKCYVKIDFRRSGLQGNLWDKLRYSILMTENKGTRNASAAAAVSRSVSNSEQVLALPNGEPQILERSSSSTRSVTFSSNSMNDLPTAQVPEDNIVPSTSANSLGAIDNTGGEVKRTNTFLKRLTSWVSKTKKHDTNGIQENGVSEDAAQQNRSKPRILDRFLKNRPASLVDVERQEAESDLPMPEEAREETTTTTTTTGDGNEIAQKRSSKLNIFEKLSRKGRVKQKSGDKKSKKIAVMA